MRRVWKNIGTCLLVAALGRLAYADSAGFAGRFVKTVTVINTNSDSPTGLVYGNSDYGYFEIRELTRKGKHISARIVPPGFRSALELYLRKEGADGRSYLEEAGEEQFDFPLSEDELSPQPLSQAARLTPVFFMGRITLKPPSRTPLYGAFIANRFGEIVWVYSLSEESGAGLQIGKAPLGNGRYAFIGEDGQFEVGNFDGTVEKSIPFGSEDEPLPFHHDFVYEGNLLTTFTYRVADYPKVTGSLLPPDRYLVGEIVKVDLTTNEVLPVWNALDDGPMLYGPGWVENPGNIGTYGGPWFDPPAHRDFDHMNSIEHLPGRGYVVSIRNLNTLLFLDESFKLKWSLGSSPGVTISTKGTSFEFYAQHHASVLPNGNILMLDNGRDRSRGLELRVDVKNMTAALVREFVPKKPIFSPVRGSMFRLKNGNTLAGFVSSAPTPRATRVVEFDPAGNQVGSMDIADDVIGVMVARMIPLDTIGRETYLGKTLR